MITVSVVFSTYIPVWHVYLLNDGQAKTQLKKILNEAPLKLPDLPEICFLNKANNAAAHFNRRMNKELETGANVSVSNRRDDSFGKVRACIAQTNCTYNLLLFPPGGVQLSLCPTFLPTC